MTVLGAAASRPWDAGAIVVYVDLPLGVSCVLRGSLAASEE